MTKALGVTRRYVCVDTFRGFVDAQFTHDRQAGTAASKRRGFQANSRALVQKLLTNWGVSDIELVQMDVVSMPASLLPEHVVVALVDVDIEAPTYAALEKLYPRLTPGGVILVDDCAADPANPFRGARLGYQRFVAERKLPERYVFGMGVIGNVPG